ncbi:MAG: penicillin-binding protein 1B, partial [Frankiaceae bacterium]|nr:penicillin-binding protein 1B [Arenimonas sp.]
RVYARPLLLKSGLRLDAAALELELASATYRNDGLGQLPGTYSRNGTRFRIGTRAFTDMDGPVPQQRLDVALAGGRVAQVRDARTRKSLGSARVDPARIATLYGIDEEERRLVRMEEVPALLITGLQAVEDRNFKSHHGIDPWGVARAIWVNLREAGFEQGASTLTQQMVRSLFLSNTKTVTRKVREALYALIIEARFDKRSIMEAYLNQVYLGQAGKQSIHGVGAGADFWFGRDLATLRTEDIALLVGIIQGPGFWDPRRFPERALKRRAIVLDVFVETGLITPQEATRAKASPLGVSSKPGVARNRAPAFLDLVKRQLARDYPSDALRGAGLSVMSTLSPSVQVLGERSVASTLPKVERKQGPALQAGMVVTDTKTGEVLAVVGNRKTDEPGFNRAIEAQRPVGSLLKPFVYLLALAQPDRYSLSSWVSDSPVEVTQPNGKPWRPKNSDGKSHGTVTLTTALARSYNQATVRVGMEVGPDRLAELMKALGGLNAKPNPSLILGSVDLSVFSMAQLYQFLASGGRIQPLRAVRGVLDTQGKAISRYDNKADDAQEGDAIAARLVTLALQSAVTSGTARPLLSDGLGPLQAAGKTGTSNDSRDSWFAGYTGEHLAVVWVGNDKNQPTGLYGATGAMRVWSGLFSKLPTEPLRVTGQGIEWAWLDGAAYATTEADCPGARRAAFVSGYLPTEHKTCQQSSWLDWFHLGGDGEQPPEPPAQENVQ